MKKTIFVTIVDGTQTDVRGFINVVNQSGMTNHYNVIVAPKRLELKDVDEVIEELKKFKEREEKK